MSAAVRMLRTPGSAAARAGSRERISAWAWGLRSVLPKSIPGATRSEPKLHSPRALPGPSGRGTDSPIRPLVVLGIANPVQPVGGGPDRAGQLLLVSREQPALPDHDPAVDDDRLGTVRRRQGDRRQGVGDAGAAEVVDPVEGEVGPLADLQRADVVAAEDASAALVGEGEGAARPEGGGRLRGAQHGGAGPGGGRRAGGG